MDCNRESDKIGEKYKRQAPSKVHGGMGSSPSITPHGHPRRSPASSRTPDTEAREEMRPQAANESALVQDKMRRTDDEISRVKEKLRRTEGEASRVREERNRYKQKYDELLSSLMSTKTEGTAKLYDGWRPDELAQKWDTFKSQSYFNAFFALIEENVDKSHIGTILLDFCKAVYNHCVEEDDKFQKALKKCLENFRRIPEPKKHLEQSLKKALQAGQQSKLLTLNNQEVEKTVELVMEIYGRSTSFLGDLETQALEEIHQQRKHATTPETSRVPPDAMYASVQEHKRYFRICEDYIKDCYGLCRMMQLQIPTMHLDFDINKGLRVREDVHEVHDAPPAGVPEGAVVNRLLVPSLYRSKDGALLVKGLVTIL